ncbi:Dynein assembly factor 2, axonemal [Intoshia linei]|uniref:PIH1 domain-containing protein 1 n=1 Tax=Intoshia linei TaxID=1819745 RepID=A0A177ATA9_9BILA|nr:Dynein assembly factor 2, axonemal [Intoshia linei]
MSAPSKNEIGKLIDDLDLKEDEMVNLAKAFKDKEFCEMFSKYTEEMSDPVLRKQHHDELVQLDRQQGYDTNIITPSPCCVLKAITSNNLKIFINICFSDLVEKPHCDSAPNGQNWKLPHAFGNTHFEMDNKQVKCKVYDVVFHTEIVDMIKNRNFESFVFNSAIETINDKYKIKIPSNNFTKLKKIKSKGSLEALTIRNKLHTLNKTNIPFSKPNPFSVDGKSKCKDNGKFSNLKYKIIYKKNFDLMNYANFPKISPSINEEVMVIEIDMKDKYDSLDLNVCEDEVTLKNDKTNQTYLNIDLPCKVVNNEGKAQYDNHTNKLTISLPIVKKTFKNEAESVGELKVVEENNDLTEPDDEHNTLCNGLSNECTVQNDPFISQTEEFIGNSLNDNENSQHENGLEKVNKINVHDGIQHKVFDDPACTDIDHNKPIILEIIKEKSSQEAQVKCDSVTNHIKVKSAKEHVRAMSINNASKLPSILKRRNYSVSESLTESDNTVNSEKSVETKFLNLNINSSPRESCRFSVTSNTDSNTSNVENEPLKYIANHKRVSFDKNIYLQSFYRNSSIVSFHKNMKNAKKKKLKKSKRRNRMNSTGCIENLKIKSISAHEYYSYSEDTEFGQFDDLQNESIVDIDHKNQNGSNVSSKITILPEENDSNGTWIKNTNQRIKDKKFKDTFHNEQEPNDINNSLPDKLLKLSNRFIHINDLD